MSASQQVLVGTCSRDTSRLTSRASRVGTVLRAERLNNASGNGAARASNLSAHQGGRERTLLENNRD
jgi:hypothetical protein